MRWKHCLTLCISLSVIDNQYFLFQWLWYTYIINRNHCFLVSVQLSNDIENPQPNTSTLPIKLEDSSFLDKRSTTATNFFIKTHKPCQISLQIQITYILKSLKPVFSIKCENLMLAVVQPFTLNTNFLSMRMENVDMFYVKEEFGILNHIEFSSPWSILIEDTSFELVSILIWM